MGESTLIKHFIFSFFICVHMEPLLIGFSFRDQLHLSFLAAVNVPLSYDDFTRPNSRL